jgi:hypothetical protein
MIIFLDFDGVMHPTNQRNLFCREEHLARVLSGFKEVEIVISSSWRLTHSLKNMQTFFLTDLRSKVVGVTPVIDSNVQFVRFYEIQKYFADTGNQHRHWVALDDDAVLFPPECPELILCDGDIGFCDAQAETLFLLK